MKDGVVATVPSALMMALDPAPTPNCANAGQTMHLQSDGVGPHATAARMPSRICS